MPTKSVHPDLVISECNILDWLFPDEASISETPVWIDASDSSHSLSPKQLVGWVKRFGLGLQQMGFTTGDSALIFSYNHIFIPVAYLSTVCLGVAFSGASPAFTVAELAHQIRTVNPKIVYVHPTLAKTAIAAMKEVGLPLDRLYLASDTPCEETDGLKDWRSIQASEQDARHWRWPAFTKEQSRKIVGTINFSSGTTGLPKGVAVSHFNLISNVSQIQSIYNYAKDETWLGFLPLYHAYGQCYAVLIATKNNIPITIMKQFNLEQYLRLIEEKRPTRLQAVPPILVMLDKRPEVAKYDLSSVKEILCGAAPLSRELHHAIENKLNVRVTQGWGMSETTCAGTGVPYHKEPITGSVGLLLPNTVVKLVDDAGKEVKLGERGELLVQGPQVALGYWGNKKATDETFVDGWLTTGDIAIMNAEGYIWIVDRIKELIKVNALQVSPAELEAVLIENPNIDDAAVVGITLNDEERPRAYITLAESARGKITEAQVQEWIKSKVAKHKWLAGGVVLVPEIPKLASGKIQRKVMRQWAKRDAEIIESRAKAKL
ncbi:4-coumarate-CoA ligase [Eremomyces bilateralis CBS 781.70]|uniref:4-coumarate-CoA ligase n=1 Tax=Eremomyces bilateralis CBS 781.70 TaxID=1392243 RepID=A0A6G1FW84_9PEZI|nr:4-coumarate-CoA ligase [Eremomyces bilateralis CBS 781.70]KAF1809941.1 4-coumarate-CoA ligase [Eremomyces bilateralis CBS 781.70]